MLNRDYAVRMIQRNYRRWRRHRPSNRTCPITLTNLNEISHVFCLIEPNGYVRGFSAVAFDEWVSISKKLIDPISKRKLNSVEIKRLHRLLNYRSDSYVYFQDNWRDILFDTCLVVLFGIYEEVKDNVEDLDVSCRNILFNESDFASILVTNLIHLYLLNKAKFRSITRQFERIDNEALRNAIQIIKSFCVYSFAYSYFEFIFNDAVCIPMVAEFHPPENLMDSNSRIILPTFESQIRFEIFSDPD